MFNLFAIERYSLKTAREYLKMLEGLNVIEVFAEHFYQTTDISTKPW